MAVRVLQLAKGGLVPQGGITSIVFMTMSYAILLMWIIRLKNHHLFTQSFL